jgi:hypothetical protein
MYTLNRMNSPTTRSLRQLELARIFLESFGVVHPKRRRTTSSCSGRWKRRGWLSGDMVAIADNARGRIARMQEEEETLDAKSRSQKCE